MKTLKIIVLNVNVLFVVHKTLNFLTYSRDFDHSAVHSWIIEEIKKSLSQHGWEVLQMFRMMKSCNICIFMTFAWLWWYPTQNLLILRIILYFFL